MTIAIMLVNGNLFVILLDSCQKTMMMGLVMGDKMTRQYPYSIIFTKFR